MRNITFLTIVAHVIGMVTVFIIFILSSNIGWNIMNQPATLLLINSIFIGYYILIGTLCYPYSRRQQLKSLIPLSVFGVFSWLLTLFIFINDDNPFAFAIWLIETFYNANYVLLFIFHSFNYALDFGKIPIYIALKLLYNILFPSVFIFAGMELKRFIIRKRGITTN